MKHKDLWLLLITFLVGFNQIFLYLHQSLLIFFLEIIIILGYKHNSIFNIQTQNKISFALIISWTLSIALSMLLNERTETVAFLRFIQTLTHILFAYHLAQNTFTSSFVIYLCYSIISPLFIIILSMIYIYHFPESLYSEIIYGLKLNKFTNDWFNNPPFYNHIRHSGFHINIAIVCSCFLIFHYYKRNLLLMLSQTGLLLTLLSFMIWTGGRGSLLSIIFALIVSSTLSSKFREIALIIFGCFILSIFISEFFRVYNWNGIFRIYNSFSAEQLETISSGRTSLWLEAIKTLNIKNIWYGHGPESFFLLGIRNYHIQPHNFIIQFIMEWGLIGTALFVGFIYNTFKYIFKLKNFYLIINNHHNNLLPVMIIITTVALALTDGSLFYPQPLFYTLLSFALLHSYYRNTVHS